MCEDGAKKLARSIEKFGFETIISIGELEENRIGSNCGQYISRYLNDHGSGIRGQGSETASWSVP